MFPLGRGSFRCLCHAQLSPVSKHVQCKISVRGLIRGRKENGMYTTGLSLSLLSHTHAEERDEMMFEEGK